MGNQNSTPPPPPQPSRPPAQSRPPPKGTQPIETKSSSEVVVEKINNREREVANNRRGAKQAHHSPHQTLKPPEPASLPGNLRDILREADSPIDKSSTDKLYDQLYSSGIFLSHKTKKFWVNKKSNCNCFMLYARALSITWGETPSYWAWIPLQEPNGTMIEAAQLLDVCWLEVNGRLDTRKLTTGVLYEVCFHVMMKEGAYGWEVPVNVKLVLPGGKKQEHKVSLMDKVRETWLEIPVGQFVAPGPDEGGNLDFSLYEFDGGAWKSGLVIKGVSIKPNSNDSRIAL